MGDGISAELHAFLEGALRVNPADRLASLASVVAWAARCEAPLEDLIGGHDSVAGLTTELHCNTNAETRAE